MNHKPIKGVWAILMDGLYDENGWRRKAVLIPGQDPLEWLYFLQHGYDWVDDLYLEFETIGGG